ncbi:molybdopterin-dependent oxidoreductase [bacterium]|nr:molybdopterin-dependent oxidoreductase [bacterium]
MTKEKKSGTRVGPKWGQVTRRTFLQGVAATSGAVAGSSLFGDLITLSPLPGESPKPLHEDWIPTTCWIGKQECGMLARRINGHVVKLEGLPAHPRNRGTLCPKGIAQIQALYDPNRVKAPLLRTNEKGVKGTWREISWDDALDLVAERIGEARDRDPSLFVWQKGRSKAKPLYDKAFVGATGALKLHHGAFCSDAGYRAMEYTIGMHGVMHPDFKHTQYLLSWGWNITGGGGNKYCWLTWAQQLVEARQRGLRVIDIDPRLRSAAHFADEWLPVRPGTDMPLALALCKVLIDQDTIDRPYLTTYTNSSHLLQEDGSFLRDDEGSPLVWDEETETPRPFGSEGISPALEGVYSWDGAQVRTVFSSFKDHISTATPEWAAEITGIPANQIRKIGRELGDNAMIGSTIEIEGHTLPYRPVAIMAYHMSQQELGFQALRAMTFIPMLLGAIGAVGGQFTDLTWKEHKNWKKLDNIEITDTPNITLKGSKYYPINSNNSSLVAHVMKDPLRYGVSGIPEVALLHHVNPLGSFPDQKANREAYAKLKFVAVIDPWLSLTADLYADVVLPASTLEKYEGPMKGTDQYEDAVALRIPPMEPIFDTRSEIEIYLDLCERLGVLNGEKGYLALVNKNLKLKPPYTLPLDKKPTPREIYDIWAKGQGIKEGVAFFEDNGVLLKGAVPASKRYPMAMDTPFGGVVPHRLYGESLLGYARKMEERGAPEIYWRDYTPFPVWRTPTLEGSPAKYDLYLTSFHKIEFKQSRTPIPFVRELAPTQVLEINPSAARARGLEDGDRVQVESHNAVTGETRKIETTVRFRESIRPDVVAMPHHYGEHTKHPWVDGTGPTPNTLFFTGEGYVSNTADQTYLVKVRVSKAPRR